jgi:hypothetical protein
MLRTTGQLIGTWLRITFFLGLAVLMVGWIWGFGSGPFAVAVVVAVVVEVLALRGLTREWVFEARGRWWWL